MQIRDLLLAACAAVALASIAIVPAPAQDGDTEKAIARGGLSPMPKWGLPS